jgi:nitroimidazol reductase NimA-like FMN-containing flavoprotein (pyridoxamine 5'-phosphate oxidase superfamily)
MTSDRSLSAAAPASSARASSAAAPASSAPASSAAAPSPRTKVKRLPARAAYDRPTIDAILDAALVAHLGFALDGQPYVIPTLHARVGDTVYFHGSAASRTILALTAGARACLTVTLLDGLVLARAALHHSVNYRSVVVLGTPRPIEGPPEREAALHAFTERLLPGRWAEARPPTPRELKAVRVLALDLDEASAKLRTGPPLDDEQDYALDVWAGVIPLRTVAGEPEPDPRLAAGIPPPPSLSGLLARYA